MRHDPALDAWRRDEPVKRVQLPYGRWCWIVTRHDDVKLVLTDARFSRRAAAQDDAPRKTPGVVQKGSLASMDGPDHTRLRRLVSRALTVRSMEALRPRTQELVDGFLLLVAGFLLIVVFGGITSVDEDARTPKDEFVIALAGPMVSIAVRQS
jgi:cytochrome P450